MADAWIDQAGDPGRLRHPHDRIPRGPSSCASGPRLLERPGTEVRWTTSSADLPRRTEPCSRATPSS